MKKICLHITFSLLTVSLFAQEKTSKQNDTLFLKQLDEIVVTATRTERRVGNVAVPVNIIQQKTISQSGYIRLDHALSEQTGLFITSNFGNGLQMQGLSSDYTLILLNGEPMIGRTSGVFNLSRLSVGNIKKIEIVQGPSSSLYGSEALAGVVNIITDRPDGNTISAAVRYGSFNTVDGNIEGSFKTAKLQVYGFGNWYSSDGFNNRPHDLSKAVAPFSRITTQWQFNYPFSSKTKLNLFFRYSENEIRNKLAVQNLGTTIISTGTEKSRDYNINPVITHRFSGRALTTIRLYASGFQTRQNLDVKSSAFLYNDYFKQEFYRAEDQTDITLGDKFNFNIGGGYTQEYVHSNRYDSAASEKSNRIVYFFYQNEWKPLNKLTVIAGLRYDINKAYASAFSPKLALNYRPSKNITVNFSYGRGFKAPDFRQLYLNFTNNAAGGYSVFGANVAREEIKRLDDAGIIETINANYALLAALKPEISSGFNAGAGFIFKNNWSAKFNLFRNDINDLIVTDIVAYKYGGAQVFSYFNIKRAYTEGLQTEFSHRLNSHFTVSGGYQLLLTADKDVLDQIKKGLVFTKDADAVPARLLKRNEYEGLSQRSKHQANLKIFYEDAKSGWFANTRAVWRSRWGVQDRDGNGIINSNRSDEYAKGYVQWNMSAGKQFKKGWRLQAGIDNLLNYRDEDNLPTTPGRSFYAALSYQFSKQHK
jgi:outer membrane receptor for ferrienterochelin and colicins